MRDGRACGASGGEQVRFVDGVPDFVGVSAAAHAGVVDEDIEAPKAVDRLLDQALDVGGLRDVRDDAEGFGGCGQLRLGGTQRFFAAGADGDAAALGGEGEGDRAADATATAGDDGYFVGEAEVHDCSLHLLVTEAVRRVVVDHADGLHEGVADGGADEAEATLLEVFAEGVRLSRGGREL